MAYKCKTIMLLTIGALVVSILGFVLLMVGANSTVTNTINDPNKVITSGPLNGLVITGSALSGLGSSLFVIFGIIWIVCAVKN